MGGKFKLFVEQRTKNETRKNDSRYRTQMIIESFETNL